MGSLFFLLRDWDERDFLKRTCLVLYSGELESELDSLSGSESELESDSESDSESRSEKAVRDCCFLSEWESPKVLWMKASGVSR